MSLSSLLLGAVCILGGALLLLQSRKERALVALLALCALAVPLTVPLRLLNSGGEIAERATHSLYIAVGIVVATFAVWLLARYKENLTLRAFVTAGLVLLVFGGLQLGSGPSARILPSTYHVAADSQSIEPKGRGMAEWTFNALGPDNLFASDRINNLLLATYGHQSTRVQLRQSGQVLAAIFMSPAFGPFEKQLLASSGVRYLAVDRRLSKDLPVFGIYFENGEPDSFQHREPLNLRSLSKFETVTGVDKVYDNGDLGVYDMKAYIAETESR
jgi:hypothetical protein